MTGAALSEVISAQNKKSPATPGGTRQLKSARRRSARAGRTSTEARPASETKPAKLENGDRWTPASPTKRSRSWGRKARLPPRAAQEEVGWKWFQDNSRRPSNSARRGQRFTSRFDGK